MNIKKVHFTMVYSLDDMHEVIEVLKQAMNSCSIITLSGPLGVGKTTLARELLRANGVSALISSPTFTYVNRYENDTGNVFYHFDLYRIEKESDFQQAGFDEYLGQAASWCIIEWPEVIQGLLKDNVCSVILSYHPDNDKRMAEIIYTVKGAH